MRLLNWLKSGRRTRCWFVVIHCPSAEDAARVANAIPANKPRILRGGERLGKRGECY